jgi:diguanylate cyclase (GGDEF)-like protein
MSIVDSAIARLLPPLSALLQRPLSVVLGHALESNASLAVIVAAPGIGIRSDDERPFTTMERHLLDGICEIIRTADNRDGRVQVLEDRIISLQRDNLDLIVKNKVLSEVSARDALTGLYNRPYVMEKIEIEMNRALRHGSPVSLLMLDIDYFKRINDEYGHPAGDEVLKGVGRVLRESCRVYDVPGRYGGEEFCIVLPETKLGNTTTVAERIRSRLESSPIDAGEIAISVTASIGIAGMDATAEDALLSAAMLIDRADRALYTAKHLGRNRIEFWTSALSPRAEFLSH